MTAPDRPESPATTPKAVDTHPTPVDGDTETRLAEIESHPHRLRVSDYDWLIAQVRTLTAERDEALRKLDAANAGWEACYEFIERDPLFSKERAVDDRP